MKTHLIALALAMLTIGSLRGQVKIGDNPQNLNQASILELESSTKALVITRVNDVQMNNIVPLRGALVYNTDHDCIHYYDGTRWVNICEEFDNTFTVSTRADYLRPINPNARDSTVVVTPTTNPDGSLNYNFEVNQITGVNIVSSSINGDSKLQNGSVTNIKIQNATIAPNKFEDGNTVGDLFRWNGTQWTLANESDILITEKDSIVGNEVVGPTDATLILNGNGDDAVPYTLDVADGGIGNAELAADAVTSDKIQDGQVNTQDLANDAVTTINILDGNVTNEKLDKNNIPLSGFAAAALDVDLGSNKLINVGEPTDPTDATTKNYVDTAVSAINTLADGALYIGDATNIAQEVIMSGDATISNTGIIDLAVDAVETDEIVDNAVTTNKILDASVTNAKLDKGNIPLSGFAAAALDVDLGNQNIINLNDPANPLDAVNLQYLNGAIAASEALDNDTDDTNEYNTGSGIAAGTLTISDLGGDQNVNLISADANNDISAGTDGALFLDETDDQTAAEVNIADAGGNFTATDVEGALTELATSNAADNDTDDTNEYNTGSGIAAGTITISDLGGDQNVNLISTDANNDISAGTDGALYLDSTIKPITTSANDVILTISDYTLILTSGGSFSTGVTLPNTATTPIGKILIIRNNSGGSVNIVGASVASVSSGNAVWVQNDGTTWQQIN